MLFLTFQNGDNGIEWWKSILDPVLDLLSEECPLIETVTGIWKFYPYWKSANMYFKSFIGKQKSR